MKFGDCAAIISAASAILTFLFSIYVFFRSRKLLIPLERPIIDISENKCVGSLSDDKNLLQINFLSIFENVGKHPASDIRIRIGMTRAENPMEFRNYVDVTAANEIRPNTKSNWDQRISVPVKVENEIVSLPKNRINHLHKANFYRLVAKAAKIDARRLLPDIQGRQ